MEDQLPTEQSQDQMTGDADTGKPASSGRGLSMLALLLALAAAGFSGWQWWQTQSSRATLPDAAAIDSQIAAVRGQQQTLSADLQQARDDLQQVGDDLQQWRQQQPQQDQAVQSLLDSRLDDRLDNQLGPLRESISRADSEARLRAADLARLQNELSALQSRQGAVEQAFSRSMDDTSAGQKALDVAEVDYLLKLASERLQLFGDADAAASALTMADRQLAAMDDPLYTRVRQTLGNEINQLTAYQGTDLLNLGRRLSALQDSVANWPVKPQLMAGYVPDQPPATDTEDGADTGWFQRLGSTLGGLVTVRRQDADELEYLTLGQVDLLRENLRLQLEYAKLASLRPDQALYGESLGRTADWLATYFDASSDAVSQAGEELAALQRQELTPELPQIGQALQQLQNLQRGFGETQQ